LNVTIESKDGKLMGKLAMGNEIINVQIGIRRHAKKIEVRHFSCASLFSMLNSAFAKPTPLNWLNRRPETTVSYNETTVSTKRVTCGQVSSQEK